MSRHKSRRRARASSQSGKPDVLERFRKYREQVINTVTEPGFWAIPEREGEVSHGRTFEEMAQNLKGKNEADYKFCYCFETDDKSLMTIYISRLARTVDVLPTPFEETVDEILKSLKDDWGSLVTFRENR